MRLTILFVLVPDHHFPHVGVGNGTFALIAPFPDRCFHSRIRQIPLFSSPEPLGSQGELIGWS